MAETSQHIKNMVRALVEVLMGDYGTPLRGKKVWGESNFQSFLGREVVQAVRVRATEKQPRPLTTTHLSEAEEGIYFEFSRETKCCLTQF